MLVVVNAIRVIWLGVGLLCVGVSSQRCRRDCLPPECSCPRFSYPMNRHEIPQMVYFGFDDAVNVVMSALYDRIFTDARRNPNGCTIKMTLFVSHQYTDYRLVKRFYERGHEIGVHSVTHSAIDTEKKLKLEARQQKANIVRRAGVPADQVVGWRSPFLKPAGDPQPGVLKELGYEYDISLTYTRPHLNVQKPWPYTMERGWVYRCGVTPCPTRARVPGFWAVPVVSLMDHKDQYPCSFVDGCAVRALNKDEAYSFLMENFWSYYNTTRSPFGLNMHAAWFYTRYNLKAMQRFLDTILQLPDVYVVTVRQMLDWMKHPTPVSRLHTLDSWQCDESRRRYQESLIPELSFWDWDRVDGGTEAFVQPVPTRNNTTGSLASTTNTTPTTTSATPTTTTTTPTTTTTTPTTTTTTPTTTTTTPTTTTTTPTTTTTTPTTTTTTPTTTTTTSTTTTTTPTTTTTTPTTTTTTPTTTITTPTTTTTTPTTTTTTPTTTTTTPTTTTPTTTTTTPSTTTTTPITTTTTPTTTTTTPTTTTTISRTTTPLQAISDSGSSNLRETTGWWENFSNASKVEVQQEHCIQDSNCRLPKCFCQGSKIPNNLALKDTPQLVYITIDGSVNLQVYRRYLQLTYNKKNPNGCPVRGTLFARGRGTSTAILKKVVGIGAEIAMQGLHEHHYDSGPHLETELSTQLTDLTKLNVSVAGWKTPELKALGNEQYTILQKYGMKYDATISENIPKVGLHKPWPYTLDFGHSGDCVIPECPSGTFPGLWEMPSNSVIDYRQFFECTYIDGCMFNPPTMKDTESFLWDNFMENYKTNKAPFGIHLRQVWFTHPAYAGNIKGLYNFITKLLTLPDVFIVSANDVITWIENPVKVKDITDSVPWKCKTS